MMDIYATSIDKSFKRWVNDDQEYNNVIFNYLESEKKTIISLQDALEKKDYARLIYLADMIYGHGWSFGFEMISRIGKAIELSAKFQAHDQLAILIFDLRNYIDFLSSQK